MSNLALRRDIAAAIHDGLGGQTDSEEKADRTLVFVDGYADPIVIPGNPPDVIIPEALSALAPGIRLDVQAILAERS
jgi:hypothetical protein